MNKLLREVIFIAMIVECLLHTFTLNIEDILNAEYLPSTLLLEGEEIDKALPEDALFNRSTDGKITEAFLTMQYHRSMMNDYMCRNYLAEEILNRIEPDDGIVARLGKPALIYKRKGSSNLQIPRQEVLLKDQGSSAYKQWLTKSSALEDAYRRYNHWSPYLGESMDVLESGDVTGYAVHSGNKVPLTGYGQVFNDYGSGGQEGSGPYRPIKDGPHSEGGITGIPQENQHDVGGERGDEHFYYDPEEHSSGKGLALKDLFELALTALAFLAFGLFVLNLIIMCVMGPQGTMIVVQTNMTTATGEARIPYETMNNNTRTKREIPSEELLNELAYHVMVSIDRLMEINRKDSKKDQCLHYSLCYNNKYSRTLNGRTRIWFPIWSFALSWIAGRFGEDRLSLLKASVVGLGNGNCGTTYSSCVKKNL